MESSGFDSEEPETYFTFSLIQNKPGMHNVPSTFLEESAHHLTNLTDLFIHFFLRNSAECDDQVTSQ